jgi:hypothetical protein
MFYDFRHCFVQVQLAWIDLSGWHFLPQVALGLSAIFDHHQSDRSQVHWKEAGTSCTILQRLWGVEHSFEWWWPIGALDQLLI